MRSEEAVRKSSGARAGLYLAFLTIVAGSAFAQAWTPPAGAGSVWFTGQTMHVDAHSAGDGQLNHNIDLRSYVLTVSADYGITDRLAMSVSLPYMTSRYRGPFQQVHEGSLTDDGTFHGAVSDLDLDLRYKAIDGTFVVTPYAGGLWPTRKYGTVGHASPGRGLTEYSAGVDIGHQTVWLTPAVFLGAGLTYTFVEKVHEDISVNRSNADLRVSWYATSSWSLHGTSSWQRTHGGLNLPLAPDDVRDHSQHHDQMLRANHWRISAGIAYAVRPSVDLLAAWSTVVKSQNAHAARALSVGVGWNFAGPKLWSRARVPLDPLVE